MATDGANILQPSYTIFFVDFPVYFLTIARTVLSFLAHRAESKGWLARTTAFSASPARLCRRRSIPSSAVHVSFHGFGKTLQKRKAEQRPDCDARSLLPEGSPFRLVSERSEILALAAGADWANLRSHQCSGNAFLFILASVRVLPSATAFREGR